MWKQNILLAIKIHWLYYFQDRGCRCCQIFPKLLEQITLFLYLLLCFATFAFTFITHNNLLAVVLFAIIKSIQIIIEYLLFCGIFYYGMNSDEGQHCFSGDLMTGECLQNQFLVVVSQKRAYFFHKREADSYFLQHHR